MVRRTQPIVGMILLHTILLIVATIAPTSASSACPHQCRCDRSRKTVYCIRKELLDLPLGIPLDTKTLFLQNNKLVNSPTLDSILSSLTSLTKLDLTNNSLTSFPKNLPPSLVWISMVDNDIKYVGSQSLGRLSRLTTLKLDNNSITNQGLSPSAFRGAENLRTISLKWNRLTSLPEGLPGGLRFAHFGFNTISSISLTAARDLTQVTSMYLNNNELTSKSFGKDALRQLKQLQYIDLSHNKLTYVPEGLPRNLTQLFLSHNLIKSINAPALGQEKSMSLAGLTFLENLDLSYNRLRGVKPGSFSSLISLRTVILYENPWQCDCHLKYLKSWLSESRVLMTMDSNTICFTPDAFQGVTLRSLDHVSLTCSSKQAPEYNISISPRSLILSWLISDSNYPDYVEYNAFCGVPKCENCSQREIIDSAVREEYTYVSSIVKSYDLFPTDYTDAENGYARIAINKRKPGQLYIVCLMGSYKDIDELTVEDCKFVKTEAIATTAPGPIQDEKAMVPAWLAVLIALLAILVLAAIVLVIYCQRLNAKKEKYKRGYNRDPLPQMTYDPIRQLYTMPATANSRADGLFEPSMIGGGHFRDGFPRGSATQDAGKEFDVTLMMNSNSNHNLLQVPSPETCESYCSDCHEDTISTSRTRTNTTDGSIGSQSDGVQHYHHGSSRHHQHPPRYESHVANSNGFIPS